LKGDGCLIAEAFTADGAVELSAIALLGDELAEAQVRAITNCLTEIKKQSSSSRPILCCGCEHAFRELPAMIALVRSARDDSTVALGMGVCDECAIDLDAALMRAIQRFMPDARKIDVSSEVGHA
jgi:hypothetical protein